MVCCSSRDSNPASRLSATGSARVGFGMVYVCLRPEQGRMSSRSVSQPAFLLSTVQDELGIVLRQQKSRPSTIPSSFVSFGIVPACPLPGSGGGLPSDAR